MSQGQLHAVVRHLRRLAGEGAAEPTDRELLTRFVSRRDQAAFAAIVERHGPMVLGVCRRALRQEQDAEDAFQATFLVLARKAGTTRWHDSVHNWLYEVASRLAAESRTRGARRRRHEEQAGRTRPAAIQPDAGRELAAVLDEELGRLPARCRAPLLLCYLEGQTSDQAARQLGWSLRTLQRRLAQGRDLLRYRLTRRGITLSAALLAPALADGAGVPALLSVSTVRVALAFTAGSGGVDLPAAALAQTALRGMAMTRWKIAALVLLVLGTVVGTAVAVRNTVAAPGDPEGRAPQAPKAGPAEKKAEPTPTPPPFAHRLWTVMDLVREKHPEPPARADMMLTAVEGVLAAAKTPVPDDLRRRVRQVETREQLTALLKEVWPRGDGAPEADVLEAAALEGLFKAVPGHGVYSPPDEARVADQISGNRYVGTGIQIRLHPDEKYPQIVVPFRGAPAQKAGIKPEDLIIEVDGKSTHELPIRKVVDMLRGEEGTTLTVVVRAPGSDEKRTVKMTRSVVPFEHVMGYRRASEDAWDYLIDSKGAVGYARVDSCSSSTPHELRQVERRLRAQGARALVLDFRSSRGESELHNGTLLADALLDGAALWRLHETGQQVREFRSGRDCLFRGWPLAVLVNDTIDTTEGGVVAALQDNGRAVLVGEVTRVGGFVTSRIPMPDGQGALTFRTGRLERTAKGRGWPVEPDHAVALTKEQRKAVDGWLSGKGVPQKPGGDADKAPDDPQLAKAVELLRAALKKANEKGEK
jgi:C-terminal peptidase prc